MDPGFGFDQFYFLISLRICDRNQQLKPPLIYTHGTLTHTYNHTFPSITPLFQPPTTNPDGQPHPSKCNPPPLRITTIRPSTINTAQNEILILTINEQLIIYHRILINPAATTPISDHSIFNIEPSKKLLNSSSQTREHDYRLRIHRLSFKNMLIDYQFAYTHTPTATITHIRTIPTRQAT